MNTIKRSFNSLMLKISIGLCIVSVVVFAMLLLQSSDVRNRALATNYNSDQVIVAVNQQRIRNGLDPLTVNAQLMSAANAKASHMSANKYFSHVGFGKKWSDFIKESGYNYAEAGENLANGFDTVAEMVEAWMNSPSHRENILNPSVTETGVGIALGELNGYPTIFVAQVFGRQREQPAPASRRSVSTQPMQQPSARPQPQTEPQPEALPQSIGELLTFPEVVVGQ